MCVVHRCIFLFSEVTVSNGISSLSSNLHLDVIYPEPKDLQVGMLSGLDPPSCIPDEFNISHLHEDEKSVLAVFVNTSVSLEASVALGTNLTFTFIFEDSGEDVTHTCEQCTSVIQVRHVYFISLMVCPEIFPGLKLNIS